MVWIYSVGVAAGATGWPIVVVLTVALTAAFLMKHRAGSVRSAKIVLFVAVCFGSGYLARSRFVADYKGLTGLYSTDRSTKLRLSGRVCGFPEQRLGGVRFPLETVVDQTPVRLLVSTVDFGVGYGDSLDLAGKLSGGRPDRRTYLFSRDAHGYLRVKNEDFSVRSRVSDGSGIRSLAWRMHEASRVRLSRHLGTGSGIPMALFLGERGWIGRGLKSSFTSLGINHLLALSGMHLGLVAGLFLGLSRLCGVTNRVYLLLILTAYVLLVGETISLYRAYLMAFVLILAARCERSASALDSLGLALFIIVLCRPGIVYSVAFQLSFTATLAVLLCVTRMNFRRTNGWKNRILTAVVSSVVVSLCVQVFLLPLQLHYFEGVSLLTPVTTLLFLPAVAWIMFLTALAIAADWFFSGSIGFLYTALSQSAFWFERILFWAASHAPPLLRLREPNLIVYYAGQAVLWFLPAAPRSRGYLKPLKIVKYVGGVFLCTLAFFCS